jgi:hypothetical protein
MRNILLLIILLLSGFIFSQNVAINASGALPVASAMLDISSTTSGLLIPRMSSANRTAIASPATGLYVYDTTTNSFWFFNGVIWVEVSSSATGWLLAGNTLAGTEILGSLNSQPVRLFSNNLERMRILAAGQVAVNSALTFPQSTFFSAATGNNNAVDGSAAGTGNAVYGQNTGTGNGVQGLSNNASGFGISAVNINASGTGIIAYGNNAGGAFAAAGSGGAFAGTRMGVYAVSTNVSALVSSAGVIGRDAGGSFTMLNGGAGVTGTGANSGVGVLAYNSGTGYALYAINNGAASSAVNGSNSNAGGTGALFQGNGVVGSFIGGGSGSSSCGSVLGVYGLATTLANNTWGGYFTNGNGDYAYVGGRTAGGVIQKINGPGAVSTIVKNTKGSLINLYCPESPEILFQDFGNGNLVNGQAHIDLDPDFSKNILVNNNHPLRVIIQLEGDCKGVFVTNKTGNGFDVKELQNGNSNVAFTWFVSANRADDIQNNSNFSNVRFGEAPGPKETSLAEQKQVQTSEEKTVSTKEIKNISEK